MITPKRPRRRRNIIRVVVYKDEDGRIKSDIDLRYKFTTEEKDIALDTLVRSASAVAKRFDVLWFKVKK